MYFPKLFQFREKNDFFFAVRENFMCILPIYLIDINNAYIIY